jgi:hypothetical protein
MLISRPLFIAENVAAARPTVLWGLDITAALKNNVSVCFCHRDQLGLGAKNGIWPE